MFKNNSIDQVLEALEPGEEVLWCQRGPVIRLCLWPFLNALFLAIWLIVGVWLIVSFPFADEAATWKSAAVAGALIGLCIFLLYVTLDRFSAGLRTVYAITDRAALLIEAVQPIRVRRFNKVSIARRRSGGGKIVFPPTTVRERFDFDRTFLGVRDMAAAEAALQRIAPKRRSFWRIKS